MTKIDDPTGFCEPNNDPLWMLVGIVLAAALIAYVIISIVGKEYLTLPPAN